MMIKFEYIQTYGWEAAIRGMRNPLNSWDRSDSIYKDGGCVIGKNDFELMQKLIKAGASHSKFMRFITVTMDITAPLYFWKEYDTYKVGTVANSCSTMHKIHSKPFSIDDFSHEHLNDHGTAFLLEETIRELNALQELHSICTDPIVKKDIWWQIIQTLPQSYNQRRTVLLNYAVLANIYSQRKTHKLDEWRKFCTLIETLPYAVLITKNFEDIPDEKGNTDI